MHAPTQEAAPTAGEAAFRAGERERECERRRRWRRLRGPALLALRLLALGAAANVAVAMVLALAVDVSEGRTESAQAWTGHDTWTVTRWSRAGAAYVLSSREGTRNWSPGQACGAPDTPTAGDRVTAWASGTQDGQEEWLAVEFPEPVVPASIKVYESYNPGALFKVGVFTADGREVEAWTGADPTPSDAGIGVSEVPLRVGFPTKKVKLYLDSSRVPGWNEIDAVELVNAGGKSQWAASAEASSVYGVSAAGPADVGGPASLAPGWSGLSRPPAGAPPRSKSGAAEAAEARGWPMLALWAKVQPEPASAPPALPGGGITFTGSGMLTIGMQPSGAPGAPPKGRAALPLRPIWGGFAVNSVFYAVVLALLCWALTVPLRFVREVSRVRRGCCVACGYDLGFDFVPGCPECGWRRRAGAQVAR